ncbi:MAG: YraN family protein [Anaerovibrio sp.]|nr:YraN family protein [Anaerovibrio sp.]
MDNKTLGNKGERLAAEYLGSHGYRIVETNYRCQFGEIDIIASRGDLLVFAEVKTRRSLRFGRPGEAVDFCKQRKITRTAAWYIHGKKLDNCHFRFDVLEILRSPAGQMSLNHIKNAFEAVWV